MIATVSPDNRECSGFAIGLIGLKSALNRPWFAIDLNLSQRDPRLVEMPKGSPRGTLRHISSLGRAPALPRRHKRAGPPSEVAETGFRRD